MHKVEVKSLANIKSAKKRIKITAKKTLRNKIIKSSTKTAIKKFVVAMTGGDKDVAKAAFHNAARAVDKAASKGVIHRNNASRKISRMAKKLNALNA